MTIWKWDSQPFGENPTNTNPSNLGTMFFKHRFPGQYSDQETGLYQNWHREYDAVLGRYVTSDPKGLMAGTNTCVYVVANPAARADPTGLGGEVLICNRPGSNDGNTLYFPHQFLCRPSGGCYGYVLSDSVACSCGLIQSDTASLCTSTCRVAKHPSGCSAEQFAKCVETSLETVKDNPGHYSFVGKNCMEVTNRIIQTCAIRCGLLGGLLGGGG